MSELTREDIDRTIKMCRGALELHGKRMSETEGRVNKDKERISVGAQEVTFVRFDL